MLCLHVCKFPMCMAAAAGVQVGVLNPLDLDLQMVMNCHVSAED